MLIEIGKSFAICFLIFSNIAFFVSYNTISAKFEASIADGNITGQFRTKVSVAEYYATVMELTATGGDGGEGGDAIGDAIGGGGTATGGDGGDGGDAIGGGGTATGGDGGDGGDAIGGGGTATCSKVIAGDGGDGGTAVAGRDLEVGEDGENGETAFCTGKQPDF
jgi:hypothetical protein